MKLLRFWCVHTNGMTPYLEHGFHDYIFGKGPVVDTFLFYKSVFYKGTIAQNCLNLLIIQE